MTRRHPQSERLAELIDASGASAAGSPCERALWDAARWTAARDEAERQMRRAVERARAEGTPWTQIGAALGMSKQAAQQRYGTKTAPKPHPDQLTLDVT